MTRQIETPGPGQVRTIEELNEDHAEKVSELFGGNRSKAVGALGISRTNLWSTLKEEGSKSSSSTLPPRTNGGEGPMPISYAIDHERRLITATLSGILTEEEIFGYQREAWSRPETRGYNELIDMSAVTEVERASADRMVALAELSSSMDPPASSKLAIVATTNSHFGLGRMYQAYRENARNSTKVIRVFHSSQEAMGWLAAGE